VSASFAVGDIFSSGLRPPQFRFSGLSPFSPHLSTLFDGVYLVGRKLDLHFQFVMFPFPKVTTSFQELQDLVLWRQKPGSLRRHR
jgi:hypothetical protein